MAVELEILQLRQNSPGRLRRHIITGIGAGVLLLLLYAGIITLAQGVQHLLEQTAKIWYWLAALATGFGIQAGLFSFIRQALKDRRAAAASVTASGGVSAGSMVACCAHHINDLLPLMGVAGLTAFVIEYQTFFMLLGVVSNIAGITIMLETIQRHNLSARLARLTVNMGLVKKGVIISAVVVASASLAFTIYLQQG